MGTSVLIQNRPRNSEHSALGRVEQPSCPPKISAIDVVEEYNQQLHIETRPEILRKYPGYIIQNALKRIAASGHLYENGEITQEDFRELFSSQQDTIRKTRNFDTAAIQKFLRIASGIAYTFDDEIRTSISSDQLSKEEVQNANLFTRQASIHLRDVLPNANENCLSETS